MSEHGAVSLVGFWRTWTRMGRGEKEKRGRLMDSLCDSENLCHLLPHYLHIKKINWVLILTLSLGGISCKNFVKNRIFEYRRFLAIECNHCLLVGFWSWLHCDSDSNRIWKDISISFSHNSLPPFEYDGVTKGCGTNSISTMMLPYLGHDITSLSQSNPLVADTEWKE